MLRTSLPEFWRIIMSPIEMVVVCCSWNGCSWWVIFEQTPNECCTSRNPHLFNSSDAFADAFSALLTAAAASSSVTSAESWLMGLRMFKAWENLQEINGFKNQEMRWLCPFRWNSRLGRVSLLPESWYHNSIVSSPSHFGRIGEPGNPFLAWLSFEKYWKITKLSTKSLDEKLGLPLTWKPPIRFKGTSTGNQRISCRFALPKVRWVGLKASTLFLLGALSCRRALQFLKPQMLDDGGWWWMYVCRLRKDNLSQLQWPWPKIA